MSEILAGATFLILMVMLLRRMTKGRISMRFRYGLWLLVMIRLIVPVSFGSSPFSVLNLAWRWPDDIVHDAELLPDEGTAYRQQSAVVNGNSRMIRNERDSMAGGSIAAERTADDRRESGAERQQGMLRQIAESMSFGKGSCIRFIWIAGILAVGGYMLAGQLRFGRYLHRMRTEVPVEELPEVWRRKLGARRMQVYQVTGLPSPCLVGRSIYIEPGLLQNKNRLSHVLSHEYAHAVQGDALWSAMRSGLCAVYWFWPFVWMAAYEAKKDSELACDERAIMLLGESQRFAYGRTLLELLSVRTQNPVYIGAVLNMGGSGKNVKERIFMIAGSKRRSKVTAAFAILAAMITCSCAFTGADTAGTGKQILLTNEGSLGNASDASETGEMADGQTQERSEEVRNIQPKPEEGEAESALGKETEDGLQEESGTDATDAEALGAERAAFLQVLERVEEGNRTAAEPMDYAAYYDYLFNGAEFPMQDGQWYQFSQKTETGIDFYGLYTDDYGFRGLKIKVGDDENVFDQPWLPTSFPVDALVLEESETDGMPRSFAFELCVVNNSTSERWQLYVADRYDNGKIELYPFREEDCREQLKDQKITLKVEQNTSTADMLYLVSEGGVTLGAVDISQYGDDKVESAVWDDELTGYLLEDDRIVFVTGIGLKVADSEEILYQGLAMIGFPVEIGSFGDRSFTLGSLYVDEKVVSVRLNP